MNEASVLPRHVEAALTRALDTMPAVVITGARQTGKSSAYNPGTPGIADGRIGRYRRPGCTTMRPFARAASANRRS